jgi:hypothetical protein
MNFSTSPVIGTIALLPRSVAGDAHLPREADDSSLEALLASLVQCQTLSEGGCDGPVRLIASGRLSRFAFGDASDCDLIRADLARLFEDLESEYNRLAMA